MHYGHDQFLQIPAKNELGYIPHANASGLRSNITNTISVVISYINNSFFSWILQGISAAISNYDYFIMTLNSIEDIAKEKNLFVPLTSNRVEGIFIIPSRNLENSINYDEITVPYLSIVRKENPNTHDYFTIDSYRSGQLAVDFFLGSGRRHPAYIGYGLPVSCNRAKLEGFRGSFRKGGVDLSTGAICTCNSTANGACESAHALFESGSEVDSIFVNNDQMAFEVLRAPYERRLRIPDDVSMFCHDDIAESKHFIPSLSTLPVFKYHLSYESAEYLVDKIRNEDASSKSVIHNPEFIVKEA